jgi:hypothetical protein
MQLSCIFEREEKKKIRQTEEFTHVIHELKFESSVTLVEHR